MTDNRERAPIDLQRGALPAVYVLFALIGGFLGSREVFGTKDDGSANSSPLARVGYALREERVEATPEAWSALRRDVHAVRAAWNPEDRGVFELVVALRGLENEGVPEWVEAERLCRELKWPRCDRPALEELARRSRP